MSAQPLNDLREFHRFVGEKVNNGGSGQSPEDVLDEWRCLHPDPDDLVAIQEAIDDIENGDVGIPFDEFEWAVGPSNLRDFHLCLHNAPARRTAAHLSASPAERLFTCQNEYSMIEILQRRRRAAAVEAWPAI